MKKGTVDQEINLNKHKQ